MPAKFRRQLKTTDPKYGSLIIDTPISEKLSDIYDGQVTLFNQLAGLAVGIIPMGNIGQNCQYLIEFPTIQKPIYGEANLVDIDLFTYNENISSNYNYATPSIEIYKLKRELPTVGTFDSGASKFSEIMFGSANYENLPSITENWAGVESTHILADADSVENLTSGDPYIPWEDALEYHRSQFGTSWGMKRSVFKDRYTEVKEGERRVYYKKKYAYVYKPRKGCKWYQNDPELDILKVDATMAAEYSPMWKHSFDKQLIKWDLERYNKKQLQVKQSGAIDPFINTALLSTAGVYNSIFDKVVYTPPKIRGNVYECFSFPYVVDSAPGRTGRALRMHSVISNTRYPEPIFHFNNDSLSSPVQTVWLQTRIPKPLAWLRQSNSKNQYMMNATTIDIECMIPKMTKYEQWPLGKEKTSHDADTDDGTAWKSNYQKYGHLLSRSFNIMLTNCPMSSGQGFANFIYKLNKQEVGASVWNGEMGGAYGSYGGATYAGMSIISHESDALTKTPDDMGHFHVVTTSESGDNTTAWDGGWHDHGNINEVDFMKANSHGSAPYVKREMFYGPQTSSDITMPSNCTPSVGLIAEDEDNAAWTNWGEWFTIRIILQGNQGKFSDVQSRVTFMLLDGSGKVQMGTNVNLSPEDTISSHVDDLYDTSETFNKTATGNSGGGFPSYLNIWTHNKRIDKDEELFSHENEDATVDVYIGSIKMYGFEPGTKNATVSELNKAHSDAKITASSDLRETLIDPSRFGNVSADLGKSPQGFKSDTLDAFPLPTTLTWGSKQTSNPFDNDAFNIFLGGFRSGNTSLIDASVATKRMEYTTGSSNEEPGLKNTAGQSFISFWHSGMDKSTSNNCNRGQDPCRQFIEDVDANEFINNSVSLTGTNAVDLFTKKGFISVSADNHYGTTTQKDANTTFSTKVIQVAGSAKHGKIRVLDPTKLKGHPDEEYIVYRVNKPGSNNTDNELYANYPLKVKDMNWEGNLLEMVDTNDKPIDLRFGKGKDSGCTLHTAISSTSTTSIVYTGSDVFNVGDIIQFKDANLEKCIVRGVTTSTNTLLVSRGKFGTTKQATIDAGTRIDRNSRVISSHTFHDVYISPYRHWLNAEVINVAETGYAVLPDIYYSHSVITDNTTAPASTTRGITYNESLYTDTTVSTNTWSMTPAEGSEIEVSKDYGYGTTNSTDRDNGKGFINSFEPDINGAYSSVSLKGLVDVDRDIIDKPNQKFGLFLQTASDSEGSTALSTTKSSNDPYLEFIYEDNLPIIEDFKVLPYEEDPFYPEYTWKANDKDLFYGFLIIDNVPILNKYHGAVLHLPLNDDTATAKAYKYDGSNNATQITASEVTSTNTVINREGLAGNAFDFDGSTAISVTVDDGDYTQPTDQMSLVAHFTIDSISATRYICSEYGGFRMWVDTSGNINAAATPSGATEVVLKSSTVVSADGETPYCVMLTFDVSLGQGNLKLFINGKVEDQSGIKTTDGSANNWKAGCNLGDSSKDFIVGGYDSDGSAGINAGTYHSGMIEEVILYNKVLYPVVPQSGSHVIIKPIQELSTSNIASGISNVAKLFIMDYHNIRGMNVDEVASTSMVSFRKSGIGLKTILS